MLRNLMLFYPNQPQDLEILLTHDVSQFQESYLDKEYLCFLGREHDTYAGIKKTVTHKMMINFMIDLDFH